MAEQYEPFSSTPPTNTAKLENAQGQKALIQAYRRCFTTDSGQRVLADLKHVTGYGKWEGNDTHDIAQVARRALMKCAVYHIEQMMQKVPNAPKPKRKESPP